ncbi:hypothetical protein [Companilactobacillus ginsenosidimutans]|uniref:Surface layer protein A domain-containing protein n=1 Tax=Companilactobacillus ginsenosidimutans TaxID=1007676 RepID=A0A0H4QHG3_9LACO|nr:hypothetical protein [Companilactobacillus ginsenosidimutans]AKP67854.1 hypothetical protein ABM34_10140 [Companilactobacillus ginsenosidimutans]
MKDELNKKRNLITMKLNFEIGDKVVSSSLITGEEGLIVDIRSQVPEGYQLIETEQSCFVINSTMSEGVYIKMVELKDKKPDSTRPENNLVKNTIHFLTNTDKEVSRTTVQGADKSKVKVMPPRGYKFASPMWNFVVISSTNVNQKMYVKSNGSTITRPSAKPVEELMVFQDTWQYSGYFTTFSTNTQIPVINNSGKTIYYLTNNYDFHVRQMANHAGQTFCQIADSAWVNITDMYEYQPIYTQITIKQDVYARLHDFRGNVVARRQLTPGTTWYTDRKMNIGSSTYYRVTTTTWVDGKDVVTSRT